MKKIVIFDFDGVIVESAPYFIERYRKLATTFNKKFDVKNMEEFRDWYDSKWENNYLTMGFTQEELENAIFKTRSNVDYYNIPHYQGIEKVFDILSKKYILTIASCTCYSELEKKLKEIDSFKYISYISPGDGHGSDKKEIIGDVIKHFNISPQNAIMVGDTEMDIKSALKNGIKGIGTAYGWQNYKKLEKAGAISIAFKPEDLIELVDRYFESL